MNSAAPFVPETHQLSVLAEAAKGCEGCPLYRDATQTVFGSGRPSARVMLIGEQPGDREDRAGAPFVGPAGRVLDKALAAAEIDRDELYLTNAVKHFKFTTNERGKRRIHKTPSRTEVEACRPWIIAELETVAPEVVVLLGATAAKSMLGNDFRVSRHRGEVLHVTGLVPDADPALIATIHPSAVLRGPSETRDEAFDGLVADLRTAYATTRTVRSEGSAGSGTFIPAANPVRR
ncbi:UdgX family uracil-DNA binding protein [Mycolicibacterium fortuitum]|uniref:UdgX family uracil-DNA binding protein n=1 Tax=Mycolicibacterium fortuitum TaxID=1766 RepID=UPI0009B5D8AD|nr:UdgX family uracil-DNA binding protein [Mycolicibacterium fortuitum]WEV33070.1 UdgX family uracil-DNA binding protein [Mycolicibacterium fortuitum]BDD96128.1 uracil-DNA glycosylase [Mycolicibacterium fortuitum subsp. fortuitum]CRL55582.1 phage SPO1 DNA polymerase-like protein [Mycolicibacterium fortuitum subsp. fortuitum DSM 46621 = ATCC 6841 = JCM 6387]CRL81166.1 phage SPO1 DNA polymerase-like protein [Mycolicibacter nonchromogenicus]